MSFFPVDRGIFASSVWLTGSAEERVLWFWLLGNRDDDGVVRHRELAIADGAKLPRDVVEASLGKFSEPDPDSRTRDHEGRRIDRTPEGFVRILNHELYYSRDYSTPRWRRWKERKDAANALANAPTPLETKDKDTYKDKDTTTEPKKSRQSGKGNGRPSTDVDLARFNRAFQATFGRRASLPPDKARVWAARLAAGYPVEFMVGLPVAAQAAGLTRDREVQPEFLLRDGSRSYSRNGETRQGFDWIGACWQQADRLKLTPAQADLLREVGAFDWWAGKGAKVAAPAEDKQW